MSAALDDVRVALAAHFPVVEGSATLSSLGLIDVPEGPRACLQIEVRDDGEVIWLIEQEIELAGVDLIEIAAWAERARERLLGREAMDACVMPTALIVPPFRPLPPPPSELEAQAFAIAEGLRAQALAGGSSARSSRLEAWPIEPRTAYFLALGHMVLGGDGIEVFLKQQDLQDIAGVLDALEDVSCEQLALRLRQGLTQCRADGEAKFLAQVDDDWIEDNGRPVPDGDDLVWPRLDSHEPGGARWLVQHELHPAFCAYVAAHRDLLCSVE